MLAIVIKAFQICFVKKKKKIRLLSGQGAADVLTEEDDTTSLAFVTFYNNASAQMR